MRFLDQNHVAQNMYIQNWYFRFLRLEGFTELLSGA